MARPPRWGRAQSGRASTVGASGRPRVAQAVPAGLRLGLGSAGRSAQQLCVLLRFGTFGVAAYCIA
eukprot:12619419-Alexandrium_andersonii.AAC.1